MVKKSGINKTEKLEREKIISSTREKRQSGIPFEIAERQKLTFEKIRAILPDFLRKVDSVNKIGDGEVAPIEKIGEWERYLCENLVDGFVSEEMLQVLFEEFGVDIYPYLAGVIWQGIRSKTSIAKVVDLTNILENLLDSPSKLIGNRREGRRSERKEVCHDLAKDTEDSERFLAERIYTLGREQISRISEEVLISIYADADVPSYVMGDIEKFKLPHLKIAEKLIRIGVGEEVAFFIADFKDADLNLLVRKLLEDEQGKNLYEEESLDFAFDRLNDEVKDLWRRELKKKGITDIRF